MTSREARNPGPSWGYSFIRGVHRWTPEPVFRFFLHLGATLAIPLLPNRARASRRYLEAAMERPVSWRDVRRHFIAFSDFLVLRFRVGEGFVSECVIDPEHAGDFEERAAGGGPLLFGTFHLGHSDLLGFWITDFNRTVRMVRQRVGNSTDLEWLHRRFAGKVEFIFVNNPENIPFAIRDAIADGHSIAMKCDRPDFSSKTTRFSFLGEERAFPVTIYHLALLFEIPVLMAFGIPGEAGGTKVYTLPAYVPVRGQRAANLERAHTHFRETLRLVESLLKRHPYQWFNFDSPIQRHSQRLS